MKIVLAFDIERAGGTNQYDTIAIGASVMDENFKELDSLLLLGYVPNETKFEPRCWTEFWSNNKNMLDTLEYKGDLSYAERQKEMIVQFQNFRSKWENFCEVNNHELVLVSDNCVYDGGFINDMIFKYMPGTLPIPYSAHKQKYKSFRSTTSMYYGFIKAIDPTCIDAYKSISELYILPGRTKKHDHNPANDAYGIAYDYCVLDAIASGKIKLR